MSLGSPTVSGVKRFDWLELDNSCLPELVLGEGREARRVSTSYEAIVGNPELKLQQKQKCIRQGLRRLNKDSVICFSLGYCFIL